MACLSPVLRKLSCTQWSPWNLGRGVGSVDFCELGSTVTKESFSRGKHRQDSDWRLLWCFFYLFLPLMKCWFPPHVLPWRLLDDKRKRSISTIFRADSLLGQSLEQRHQWELEEALERDFLGPFVFRESWFLWLMMLGRTFYEDIFIENWMWCWYSTK